MPFTTFQTSGGVKGNHSETTGRQRHKEPMTIKTSTLTPHHRQCQFDFYRPRPSWSVTNWRRVIFSDVNPDSVSMLTTSPYSCGGLQSYTAFVVERHTLITQATHYQQETTLVHLLRIFPNNVFKDMRRTPWPTRSPDLLPIKYGWNLIGSNCSHSGILVNQLRCCKDFGMIFRRRS
ncbi:hypothetical protein TNCV_1138591 [Trichonephila clavipes]|nr:hypothetical protein TNCV_1138591 [Trichonephila clavipes]